MIPLTIPNVITLSRIITIPFIVGVFYFPDDLVSFSAKNVTATAIFIFAAVTDWLDGYLARKLNQMSAFGGLRGVQSAAIDDIAKVAGISRPLAERIYKHLHESALS